MEKSKRMTAREYLKLHPEKFVMVTREFGDPIYIAPLKDLMVQVTPNRDEAEEWTVLDKSDHKLGYHKVLTGYSRLSFELA